MPNWCCNKVTFRHEDSTLIDKISEAFKSENLFETFVPLGEWDYDKAIDKWGTKWEVDGTQIRVSPYEIVLNFNSAWAPPTEFYTEMENQGFDVSALWFEPGMMFWGEYSSLYGVEESEYSSLDDLPGYVVEEFGIEEWEEA